MIRLGRSIAFACCLALAWPGIASAQDTAQADVPGANRFFPVDAPVADVPTGPPLVNARTVRLDARLTEDGVPLKHGLTWRIYQPGAGERMAMVAVSRGGATSVLVAPGEYLVHVAFGLASTIRPLTVPERGPVNLPPFIINAGGLVLNAVSGNNAPIPSQELTFAVYTGTKDTTGRRRRIISGVRPGQTIRLAHGTYHVVSKYGNANAIIRSDIAVEAGKLTEAIIQHRAATIILKLVSEEGGEAIPDTAWSITNSAGDLVGESIGAFPTVVLSEGNYTAIARHKDRSFKRDFSVSAGFDASIEVLHRAESR